MSEKIVTIQKLDPVKLVKEKLPFTTYRNFVIQNIRDHLALAIWVYLGSMPDDWQVHRTQLMTHFEVGRDRLGAALKYLNENRLIEYIQFKNEAGMFQTSHILVKSGEEFEVIHRSNTALLKNRTTDFPDNGKTAPTNTIRNTNTKSFKNKSFSGLDEQKANRPVDNPPPSIQPTPPKTTPVSPLESIPRVTAEYRPSLKEQNERRHAWADKTPTAAYSQNQVKSMVPEWGPGNIDYDRKHVDVKKMSLREFIGEKKSAIMGDGAAALHELAKKLGITDTLNHSLKTA